MTKINLTENKILDTIRDFQMFFPGDRVLVGLSGGKDSVALLYALWRLASILKINVVALHVNHGIRGEEADNDELFAKSYCEKLNVEFYSVRVDVPSLAETSHEGLESVARQIRYEQFLSFSLSHNCNKIATAHTASDNTETYLINLLRNSNAKGIPPVRDNIVRPLIRLTSQEILEYCKDNKLEYVTDSTNSDDHYTRNFIRIKIIPMLSKLNPKVDECILRDTEVKRSYEELCHEELNKYYSNSDNPLLLSSLKKLSSNIAYRNILFLVLREECAKHGAELSFSQFSDIELLINNGRVGQSIVINKNVSVYKSYDALEIRQKSKEKENYEIVVKHGKNFIPDSNLVLFLETEEEYNIRKNNEQILTKINKLTKKQLIKYNIIDSCLFARSRKNGDAFVCNGMTKKIKKYMIDEKIPSDLRSRIPVVCDDKGIIWVPGMGIADRIKQNDNGETYIISLDFTN